MRNKRISLWIIGSVTVFLLLAFLAAWLVEEPLRRYMENGMNESLEGYSAQLESVDFHPIGLSVTLRNLQVIQDAHPDRPVAHFPYLHAGVHWREIFHARLVADFDLHRPSVYINLIQIRKEASDEEPVEERGWQDAVRAIYPLKINLLTIRDGDFVYIDEDPDRPLHLGRIFFKANNIRNIVSPEESYPSPLLAESTIFEKGTLRIYGAADFLREPYPGVNARVELDGAPLDHLRPILARYNFFIGGGEFSASGDIEHSPKTKFYRFDTVEIRDVNLDYRIQGPASEEEKQTQKKIAKEAVTADSPEEAGEEEVLYLIENLSATGSLGLVNTAADPQYRVFINPFDLRVTRLSNGFSQGEARAELSGEFMGSGETVASASFRPERNGADFNVNLEIEGTSVPAMNDLLRAYGNFDVTAGTFSLVSEIRVNGQWINGYVKPFFKDLDVYDPRQEEGEGLLQKAYEGVIGDAAELLENEPREQVATKTDFSGKLDDPETSTWQTVINLIRNAYFEAILPRFEADATAE